MGAASETARPDHPAGNRARTAIGWAAGGAGTPPPSTEPEAAREGYETGARLGGNGEVYEATHVRLPGRFAIKFLTRARGASATAIETFQDEAERVSVLRHPNIAEVLELGVMPDGTPIVVMEHLEGRSLDLILAARGPMPLSEVLPIVRGIATGLHAAHEVNVVHREVRPDNVFIAKVAGYEQGFVKLLDFGVSRLLPSGPAQGLSAAAARFLAPEQARGVGAEVDARTDQYSLAVLTYRMLAGADLFQGEEAISVLYHVLHDTPRPLTQVIRIDRDVEAVIRKGMSQDKQERFGSVIAFLRALEEAAAGQRASPQMTVAARGGKPSRSSWFFRRARTEEVPEPAAANEAFESKPETREEAQVSSERSSGEYRVAGRGDERSSISRQSRALTLRDTLSERFFAEGERKAEEGDWSPSDLDDERPEGLDDVESFDSIPRRRWPIVVGLAAVIGLVPLAGWMFPDWRAFFSGRPNTFWTDPSKSSGTVLPTTVAEPPPASAAVSVPIPGAGTPSVPSAGTSVPPSAPPPAPHAVAAPGTAMPATTAPAALPPPSNVAQPPPPPPPAQRVTIPSVPAQSAPAAAQPMVVPAVPVAPAQPAAVPTQPSSVGAWAPRAAAPAATPPSPPSASAPPRAEGNVPLRGYVWSPKEHRLVPAN